MLDDLGIQAKYTHDGSDHKERRPFSALAPDKSRYRRSRILVMVRDPRDTAVSGYFQTQKRHGIDVGSMSDFLRDERHGIEKIAVFNLQWLDALASLPHVALVTYEALSADPVAVLAGISAFLGAAPPPETLTAIAEARSFRKMRVLEASGELAMRYGAILKPRDPDDPESFKVRRGKVGGFTDYLSEADIAYCDRLLDRYRYWARLAEAEQSFAVIRHRR
jgi:hypothetical protein